MTEDLKYTEKNYQRMKEQFLEEIFLELNHELQKVLKNFESLEDITRISYELGNFMGRLHKSYMKD